MTPLSPAPEPAIVLEYQTPISRRRLRKPLRTQILHDPDAGLLAYTEVSADKSQARGALLFSLVPLAVSTFHAAYEWSCFSQRRFELGDAILLTCVVLILLALIGAVLTITWRRTTLYVRDGVLLLEVTTPFSASARKWPADGLLGIEAWTTDAGDTLLEPIAELHIRPRFGSPFHLFRDYPRALLAPIAEALSRELGMPGGS